MAQAISGQKQTGDYGRSRSCHQAHLQLRLALRPSHRHQGRHRDNGSPIRLALHIRAGYQRRDHDGRGLPRRQVRQPLRRHAADFAQHDGHILLPARNRPQLLADARRHAASWHRPLALPLTGDSFALPQVPRQAQLCHIVARHRRQRRRIRRPLYSPAR